MTPAALALAFGVGLGAGLLSGLVGIGGGVVIVPFLYFFYSRPELAGVALPAATATVAAHATSLFVIVPTSIRGARAYHRAGQVVWRAVWPIGAFSVVAAFAGSWLATRIPAETLRLAFGVLLVVSGLRLARRRPAPAADEPPHPLRLSLPVTASSGAAVGLFSALLGVGGGIVSIPLLIHAVGIELRRVAATSMGIIVLTATAGTVSYMLRSPAAAVRPGWSVGYVDVAAGVAIFAGSLLAVRWGTALNQRMNPRGLALLFAVLFVLTGARLVLGNLPF